jgi:translation initiation factor 4E
MTQRVIRNELNSQFECIGLYTKESHEVVRQNIINELKTFKEEYVDLLNEEQSFEEYIEKMSKLDVCGDNITLIAASQYYKLNIGVNDEIQIVIKENEEDNIDLFLTKTDENYYYVDKEDKEPEIDKVDKETEVDKVDKPIITIFDDPKNFNVKHPLNTEWSLWISTKVKSDNWLDTIKNVVTVGSVEDFWGMFNNIPEAGTLNFPFDYYLFRNGILPMWEAPENKNGGKMTITFKKTCDLEYFNKVWLYTILGCIGEQFDDNYICGIVLNIRKHQDRVNVWLNTSDEENIKKIGIRWKEILELPKIHISYIKHDNSDIQYII